MSASRVAIGYRASTPAGGVLEIRDMPVACLHGGASDLFPKKELRLSRPAIALQ